MKYLILSLLILFFVICNHGYASDTFFEFKLSKNLVLGDEEIIANFFYNLSDVSEESFLVRPVIENGLVKVFDPQKPGWVSGTDVWSSMPRLGKEMRIRIGGMKAPKTFLCFEVKDLRTAVVYKTSKKPLWSKTAYGSYVDGINESLRGLEISKQESNFSSSDVLGESTETTQSIGLKDLSYNFVIFGSVAAFLIGAAGIIMVKYMNEKY